MTNVVAQNHRNKTDSEDSKMRKLPSLVGNKYGKLTVIEQAETTAAGHRRWLCSCDCGGTAIVESCNLTKGHTTSCGCVKSPDLTGKVFGRLTVLGRSDKRYRRGARTTPMWECRCECGNVVYRLTDMLKNSDISMCQTCAKNYALESCWANAGFVDGTQLSKIQVTTEKSNNLSGVRGVYFNSKKGLYTAAITFQGKRHYLGSYKNLEDAIKARRLGEEKYFEAFLYAVAASAEIQAPAEKRRNHK